MARARKAVITAAGRGTRQFPATRAIQKELLPIVDVDGLTKPTIQIILQECIGAGIEEVCIVVEKGGQGPFESHFRAFTEDELKTYGSKEWMLKEGERIADMARRITYVEQPSPEGFGHAVYQARDFVGAEPFLLLLGDHVYTTAPDAPSCVYQILSAGEGEGGSITSVRLEPEKAVSVTGIVKCKPLHQSLNAGPDNTKYDQWIFDIEALKEKPTIEEAKSYATPGVPDGFYLCHFGLHLFTPEIFDALHHLITTNTRVKNEFQLTSAQELLLQASLRGEAPPYRAAILEGTRWDTGMPDVYLETLLAYAKRGPFAEALGITHS